MGQWVFVISQTERICFSQAKNDTRIY